MTTCLAPIADNGPDSRIAHLDFGWMTREVALIQDQLGRVHRAEDRERTRVQLRAKTAWYDDRMREVEVIGRDLARRPSEVVSVLTKTPQGCEWMIDRWSRLARIAQLENGWNDAMESMAFDLMGTPTELRVGNPGERMGRDGKLPNDGSDAVAVALAQVKRLLEIIPHVKPLDDFDRDSAIQGLHRGNSLEDRQFRSHEAALHRRLKDFLRRLDSGVIAPAPRNEPKPAPTNEPKLEPAPLQKIEANGPVKIDPRLESIFPDRNEPKPETTSRADRRLQKAERRRMASDRKLIRRNDLGAQELVGAGGLETSMFESESLAG